MTTSRKARKTTRPAPSRSPKVPKQQARKQDTCPVWETLPGGYYVTREMLKDRVLALDSAGWPLDM